MNWLNDQISMVKDSSSLSFVINPQVKKWEESLLIAWLLMWYVCGGVIAYFFYTLNSEEKLFVFVFFIFWAYYAYKITKIFFWKKQGKELIRIKEGELQYKQSIGKYGKLQRFALNNIEKMELTPAVESSFLGNIENSLFWTYGTPALLFKHKGKYVKMGYINDKEMKEKVFNHIKSRVDKELKKA